MSFSFYARWDTLNSWSRIFDFGNGEGKYNILIANEGTSNTFRVFVLTNEWSYADVPDGIEIGVWAHWGENFLYKIKFSFSFIY